MFIISVVVYSLIGFGTAFLVFLVNFLVEFFWAIDFVTCFDIFVNLILYSLFFISSSLSKKSRVGSVFYINL